MIRQSVPGASRASSIRNLAELICRAGRNAARRVLASAYAASHSSARAGYVETLEKRELLAGVSFTNGILKVSGSETAATTLTVMPSGSSNVIAKSGSISKTVAKSQISKIEIYGGAAADTVRIDKTLNIPSYIDVKGGNDYVSGGAGADEVWGDTGNDTVYGNGGNDSIAGEAGNDLLDGGDGTDILVGGSGTNVIKNGTSASSIPASGGSSSTSSSAASITGLELWNADTDKKIQTITSGSTLDLSKLPAKLTLVAQGSGASVKFGLDSNSSYRIESGKPWAIAGDTSGNLAAWSVPTGSHTIKLTPYSKSNATGTVGAVKSFTINFTKSSTSTSGGGSTTTNPPPPTTTGIVPRNSSAASPNAVITAISGTTIHAGQSFHANAMASGLGTGTPLTARYVWDFGDPGSDFNTMVGFNAAHVYEDAGTYTVKLTLTNEAGKTDVGTKTVTVTSSGRKVYYVSNSGSDSAAGTQSAPLKTFGKAKGKLADNVEILFKGGETFDVKDTMTIYKNNVIIGSYGSGRATLKFSGPKDYAAFFYLGGQGHKERIVENLIFDSIYTSGTDQSGMPQGVGAAGVGDAIVNNEFRNVGYAVNSQSNPDGLLVQDNNAPLKSGIREYFFWGEGRDITIQGNNVVNSVFAHIVRIAGVDRLNVSNNTFSNPPDAADGNIIRGVVTVHQGNYAYVANNTLNSGPTAIGPLGRETGKDEKSARFHWSVFEGNTVNNSQFLILHGSEHNMFRNNVVNSDGTWAFELEAYDATYGRGVVDTTIVNNTAVNDGATGNFLRVLGASSGINLINNLYIAPKLVVGDTSSGPVLVFDNDLSSFQKITGNVWAVPTATKYAEGGYNYVWTNWSNSAGYKTPTEWANYGVVDKDVFSDVAYSGYTPSSSSAANGAGVVWAGVWTDKNGKIRSNSGSWTAGAVEV